MKKVLPLLFLLVACAEESPEYDNPTQDEAPNQVVAPPAEVNCADSLLAVYGCNSCHKMDNKMTGPPLMGTLKRWNNDTTELIKYIRMGHAYYLKSGGKYIEYAEEMRARCASAVMPGYPQIPDSMVLRMLRCID